MRAQDPPKLSRPRAESQGMFLVNIEREHGVSKSTIRMPERKEWDDKFIEIPSALSKATAVVMMIA